MGGETTLSACPSGCGLSVSAVYLSACLSYLPLGGNWCVVWLLAVCVLECLEGGGGMTLVLQVAARAAPGARGRGADEEGARAHHGQEEKARRRRRGTGRSAATRGRIRVRGSLSLYLSTLSHFLPFSCLSRPLLSSTPP